MSGQRQVMSGWCRYIPPSKGA